MFIVFEGGEGSGKSTQIKSLSNKLSSLQIDHIVTREPGGTPISEQIRDIVVKGGPNKLDSETDLLLFTAARRLHLNEVIMPAQLKERKIVLCDRYFYSTFAYQSCEGSSGSEIIRLHEKFCYNHFPNLVFFLDIDPEQGLERSLKYRDNKETRFENFDLSYHKCLREKFFEITQYFKSKSIFVIVDARATIESISEYIFEQVQEEINKNQWRNEM